MQRSNDERDERLELIYNEAVRSLAQQQAVVENMNLRASSVIFATTVASSFLGAQALADGVDGWDWLALLLLLGIGALIALLLWPYQNYRFRFDPNELLATYVDTEPTSTLSEMHRDLAVRIERDRRENWRVIQRLRIALQVTLLLLVLEILVWLLAIASAS